MTETYCGIDPGFDGAIVVIRFSEKQTDFMSEVMPTFKLEKSKRDYDIRSIADILYAISLDWTPQLVALERAQPMPAKRIDKQGKVHRQGIRSTFSTGRSYGILEGVLTTSNLPFLTVRPVDWHRQICKGLPGDAKAKALKRVQTTLPNLNLLATPRCKKPHSGIVDAACLALYARHWWKCKEDDR